MIEILLFIIILLLCPILIPVCFRIFSVGFVFILLFSIGHYVEGQIEKHEESKWTERGDFNLNNWEKYVEIPDKWNVTWFRIENLKNKDGSSALTGYFIIENHDYLYPELCRDSYYLEGGPLIMRENVELPLRINGKDSGFVSFNHVCENGMFKTVAHPESLEVLLKAFDSYKYISVGDEHFEFGVFNYNNDNNLKFLIEKLRKL